MATTGTTTIMEPTADELARKTLQYWELSSTWNGRTQKTFTTQTALSSTRRLITSLNPSRPLYEVIGKTEDEIIRNRKRKASKTTPQNLLPFQRKAQA